MKETRQFSTDGKLTLTLEQFKQYGHLRYQITIQLTERTGFEMLDYLYQVTLDEYCTTHDTCNYKDHSSVPVGDERISDSIQCDLRWKVATVCGSSITNARCREDIELHTDAALEIANQMMLLEVL